MAAKRILVVDDDALFRDFLKENTTSMEVIFCCFSEHDLSVYKRYVACNSEALTEGRDIWE